MRKLKIIILALSIALFMTGYVFAEANAAKKPQATCPVMGGTIDKKVYTDHKGKRVYFCCSGCIDVFKKDPEKYTKIIEDKGETIGDIPAEKSRTNPVKP